MAQQVTVAVDAMGGDRGPSVVLQGVADALQADPDLSVVLCGPADVVQPFAADLDRCQAVTATEVVTMDEHPAKVVRTKKDSSLVVGCRQVKEGKAQGFFSAGSTGACLAAGMFVMGRVKGVQRPALATVVPSPVRESVMLDIGANADCKPEYLVQFATMGTVFARSILGIADPQVALLNIGEEDEKGSALAQESHKLLRAELPNFAGNCEGRDVLASTFDVVVTDGFTGNVCLKTIEGTAKVLMAALKERMTATPVSSLGALLVKNSVYSLKDQLSPDTYGGGPLLGVKGELIVGHGSSNELAIKNGILTTARMVRAGVWRAIAEQIAALDAEGDGAEDAAEDVAHEL